MIAFKHILLATDFGEAASPALDAAIALATKFEARLTLLHAYSIPAPDYGAGLLWPVDELSRAAKTELDRALREAKVRYERTDAVLACGEPWREIVQTAQACRADLIVMGTHGRRGLSRAILGSVAEKVVRLSPIPVLTVASKEEQRDKEKAVAESAAAMKS